jgi:hypothetical protein
MKTMKQTAHQPTVIAPISLPDQSPRTLLVTGIAYGALFMAWVLVQLLK